MRSTNLLDFFIVTMNMPSFLTTPNKKGKQSTTFVNCQTSYTKI